MNLKAFGTKEAWPNLRQCFNIFQEGQRITILWNEI
jgi:hypothetical protein